MIKASPHKILKLQESLSRGALSHALLIETHDNTLPALESFFRSFLCQKGKVYSCGHDDPNPCESCRIPLGLESRERQHPDFWVPQSETETAYTVEQVREWESKFLYLSKNIAPRKLLVIPQAEKLSGTQNAAANALLKILEEPRPGTFLILMSSNTLRLLPTIRSRCLKINLKSELANQDIHSETLNLELNEIFDALWGRFMKTSNFSNASWWKNKAERISAIEAAVPLLWKKAKLELPRASRDEALAFWTRWKHFEDYLWALKHYGNPGIHWLNFKRKVLLGQPWRLSKLFG